MSKNVNLVFEVAPNKKDDFLKASAESRAFELAIERASKNVPNFRDRTVKRK